MSLIDANGLQADARQRLALALAQQGADTSPARHWTVALGRIAQSLAGNYDLYRQNEDDKAEFGKLVDGVLSPAGATPAAPAAPMPAPASGPAPQPVQPQPVADASPAARVADVSANLRTPQGNPANAISSIESGGKYDLLGPVISKGHSLAGDRAYGKYQVMGSNVGPWTKQYLGQEMTPQQFIANPSAQDAVFQGEFGRLSQKYGPEGAARAWFAGEGGMNQPGRTDQLGTSVANYGQRFANAAGVAPSQRPQITQVAQAMAPPTGADALALAEPEALVQSQQPQPVSAPPSGVQRVAQAMQPSAAPSISPAVANIINAARQSNSPEMRKLALGLLMQNATAGVSTVDLGNAIGVMDKQGNIIRQIPKGEPNKGPSFGVIGETPMGGKLYGWPNPRDQSVTPYTPPQSSASTDALANLHGEDFMAALEKSNSPVASQVRAIVEGRAPYPTGMLLKTPYGQTLAQYVTQADPSFESGNPAARTKIQADLATGALGKNNNALNTAIGHLGELSDAAIALDNSTYPAYNKVANFAASQTGDPRITNFNTIRDKVAEEFTRVYRGAGGSESDIKREIENLNAANSPAQLHGAIANMARLAQSKIDANESQYKGTMGPMVKASPMVTEKTRGTLNLLEQRESGKGNTPAPQAAPQTATGPNGQKLMLQNGQWVPMR